MQRTRACLVQKDLRNAEIKRGAMRNKGSDAIWISSRYAPNHKTIHGKRHHASNLEDRETQTQHDVVQADKEQIECAERQRERGVARIRGGEPLRAQERHRDGLDVPALRVKRAREDGQHRVRDLLGMFGYGCDDGANLEIGTWNIGPRVKSCSDLRQVAKGDTESGERA